MFHICTRNFVVSMLGIGYKFPMCHHFVFVFGISDAHIFTADPSNVCDCGYQVYGELARFTYCLLQKIKSAQALPLIEKWQYFIFPNHSWFLPVEEKEFLAGSPIAVALENVGSFYLRNDFRNYAGKLLEDRTSIVLSIVAVRSEFG